MARKLELLHNLGTLVYVQYHSRGCDSKAWIFILEGLNATESSVWCNEGAKERATSGKFSL